MKLIVLTGASRSGTTFMSGLLDRATNTASRHEFLSSADFAYVAYYNSRHPSLRHDIENRLKEAERLVAGGASFVDVNCKLAFALEPLREARPDVKLFHLVRDARAVIASQWVRKMYTTYSKGILFIPDTEDQLAAWQGYDRFQRLAWLWNRTVTHLLSAGLPVIKLENAIADFDYLKSNLLGPAGIDLSRAAWEQGRSRQDNKTPFKVGDLLRGRPLKLDWTSERHAQFEAICGETMRALGYGDSGAKPQSARSAARASAFVPPVAPASEERP